MADNKKKHNFTIFQKLDNAINNDWISKQAQSTFTSYDMSGKKKVLFKTKDKNEYELKLNQMRQTQYLANMWYNTSNALTAENVNGISRLTLMYRDVELMDGMPEIGTALDMVAEESTLPDDKGSIVNVYSSSERVKTILEDLFVNRLNLSVQAAMIIRGMAKYGNMFYLLNVTDTDGVIGWRQLPVTEMSRVENSIDDTTGLPVSSNSMAYLRNANKKSSTQTNSVSFVWLNGDTTQPFFNWQVVHFRLLTDNSFLPYGTSFLHKARRHWRLLTIMEDEMLIYRLERSIERRVFKIPVGNIDEKDVPAFMDEVANKFKRAPIVDPLTGQLDLRKNLLSVSDDYFIPVRDASAPNPIETLASAKNLTEIDDIKYIQQKVLCALRVPLSFLSFDKEGGTGDGGNLAMKDIRFVRTINRMQQAFLEELTKIATTHLYMLGFEDDLRNFVLTMNNPSTQAEQLEIETLLKKIEAVRNSVSDSGCGIPMMSMQRALKTIMKWSEKDIKDNLQELRLEKALAKELEKTDQIIKRTTVFDEVDRIYGETNARYQDEQAQDGGDDAMGGDMGAPMGGGMDFGGDMGAPMDAAGMEGEIPMDDAGGADAMSSPDGGSSDAGATMESREGQPVLTETFERFLKNNLPDGKSKTINRVAPIYKKDNGINEEYNSIMCNIKDYFNKAKDEQKDL